jgi:hypothetical protein
MNIVKLSFQLVCICGLIYQTSLLLRQYMSGNTVVNLNVNRIYKDITPAITLCFPMGISMKKLSQINNRSMALYQEYIDHFGKAYKKVENDSRANEIFKELTSMIIQYKGDLRKFTSNYTWLEFIDKYTIDIDNILFLFNGNIYNGTNEIDTPISPRWFKDVVTKSVMSFYPLMKCFTMFSSMVKQWRNIETNIVDIRMMVNTNPNLVFLGGKSLFLAIHSANTFPSIYEMSEMKVMMTTEIAYSMTKTTLLDSRYNTDCIDYNFDYRYTNYNMRSDCIVSCIQQELSCQGKILPIRMIRTQELQQYPTMEVCFNNDVARIDLYCIDKCKKDCIFDEYRLYCKAKCKYL